MQLTGQSLHFEAMARDSVQTKARLLQAAIDEFAAYGIAGARVDRIAEAAATNKQMIYSYFGNKDELFDQAFSADVERFREAVDFDPLDLPGYAGRLFDRFEDDASSLRLSTWYRLERPTGPGLQAVAEINDVRLQRLRDAQKKGAVTTDFAPAALLALIQSIATSWSTMNPEFTSSKPLARKERRRTVVEAVRRIVSPT